MANTILGKVIEAVLSVFKDNWKDFIVKLWKKIPMDMKEELLNVVDVVDTIKTFIDSKFLDAIVQMTGTKIDDKVLAWLREISKDLRLDDLKVSDLTWNDYHAIATNLTIKSTGVSKGQAIISTENAFQNR